MNIQKQVILAPLTTLGVGGEARFFVTVQSTEEAIEALAFARANALETFVLGGGSNIVIADSGFDGLVINMRIQGITAEMRNGCVHVNVGSGVAWDEFVVWTIENGLCGLECLSGVPGTVGGAVVANLGAYGAQCSDTFLHAEVIDIQDESNAVRVINKDECKFAYHDSMFGNANNRYVIVRAAFSLSTDPAMSKPSYRDNRFDMTSLAVKLGRQPTQKEVRESVLDMREKKGSLIMKDRISFKSAGSFFHMPFVSEQKYEQIKTRAGILDAEKEKNLRPWTWKQPDGLYKVAPGFLLEYTRFQKGYVQGGAGVSPLHTLSIINIGTAHAEDIARLAREMQTEVEKIFDVRLDREVEYIGDVENKIF